MRIATVTFGLLALGACSRVPERHSEQVADIANAAGRAANSVGAYNATKNAPKALVAPAQVASTSPPQTEVVSEAPFTPDSAQGAADVVQTYYALIGEQKYRQAWALWGDGGQASGMSAAAFAASFAKYRDYNAEVGAPGRVEAGAGQRYVTVPVTITGHLKDGNHDIAMSGPVTLHRTGVDGATAEQRLWRISDSGVRPRPATIDQPDTISARYRCDRGFAFVARFDNRANNVALIVAGKRVATLAGQPVGSGIWYKGEGYELRGKGMDGTLTRPDGTELSCTAPA